MVNTLLRCFYIGNISRNLTVNGRKSFLFLSEGRLKLLFFFSENFFLLFDFLLTLSSF